MNHNFFKRIVLSLLLLCGVLYTHAQQRMVLNLGMVDGVELSKTNLFDYQIISTLASSRTATLNGQIRYRNMPYTIGYSIDLSIQPGVNNIREAASRARMTYSSGSMKELFEQYGKLPEGIYEYCVTLTLNSNGSGETAKETYQECVYGRGTDVFLINLVDPEDKARLYEYNPMLSWTVNYPFAAALSYKLKVVELKQGQNAAGAVKRNNAVYEEKGLMQLSQTYPVYAKPLQLNHTYAWTVDAYYKDILLGGAEAWTFTIVEDTLLKAVPKEISYYDFAKHIGETKIFAVDTLKLKYQSYTRLKDSMKYQIVSEKGKEVISGTLSFYSEPTYFAMDLTGIGKFQHNKTYYMYITDAKGKKYTVPFIYINSLYLDK
ncbi:hypothetical protein [Sphingobacterium multivorum]|uniref:hypothetical protein n=1 Tax=Sphingobacterium multivorum TaxID=28454 RepID=UPI0028A5ED38|nr:hypothetical protein [Sphingobacterium multivorum]